MAKKKQGGQSLKVTQAIKPIGIAKDLLPTGTDPKVVRALANKIIDRNKNVVRGQSIKAGTTVNVGKATTNLSKYLPNNKVPVTLKDQSLTNRIMGLGKIQATPMGPIGNIATGTPAGGSDSSVPAAIKTAPIDTVEFVDEALSAELLLDLLFEDVGGQELLTIARNDTVNGQDVVYQPFKNLGILQEIYNPTNLLKLQETSDKIFSNFTINLRDRIPKVGSGSNGANYYLDLAAGDGIIEFINLKSDEQVEIQIVSAGIIEDVGI
jgi:hypothetical protein